MSKSTKSKLIQTVEDWKGQEHQELEVGMRTC